MDPHLSLAFSLHSNPGVYALLLGSGVSRAAEVPTGWEVILDLTQKLAHLEEEDCGSNPAEWYRERFDEAPSYSKILNRLARSPEERSQLLKGYFEPTKEERERGAKLPSKAHHAVAKLVAQGTVRVVVTTNFDRLTERALEEAGVSPTVIASPDAAEGAIPLAHSECTILKLHGDYLDTRIKNTEVELSTYDERIDRLLDQVFDEYGLVVCGWSGKWDRALISAFERCESRRFSTYWAVYQGNVSEEAERLIDLRDAEVVSIEGADSFFGSLAEKVEALRRYDRPHPLSSELAVSSLKRYLAESRHRIALHDLVMDETDRVREIISGEKFHLREEYNRENLTDRVTRYESALEVLVAMFVHGCYWGEEEHRQVWETSLQRVANVVERRSGTEIWLNLSLYPALLLSYAGGIAAVANEKYGNLFSLLKNVSVRHYRAPEGLSALYMLDPIRVMKQQVGRELSGKERNYTPLSDHLFEVLRPLLQPILPDEWEYERAFDRFEYLRFLLHVDAFNDDLENIHGPVGRFGWHYRRFHGSDNGPVSKQIEEIAQEKGENWGLLQNGAFSGSMKRFKEVKEAADNRVEKLGWG